jgi:hypothetical protein
VPETLFSNKIRRMATGLCDGLYTWCRSMGADHTCHKGNGGASGGSDGPKTGYDSVERYSMSWNDRLSRSPRLCGTVVAQLLSTYPARGREILAQAAELHFGNVLPQLIQMASYTGVAPIRCCAGAAHWICRQLSVCQDQLDDADWS